MRLVKGVTIRGYNDETDRDDVVRLWSAVFDYRSPHNAPTRSIDLKLRLNDGLFFVAVEGAQVIGTVLAGYDGHRGWIYSLAVAPARRGQGTGSALLRHAEQALAALGCPKINLQVMPANDSVVKFYEKFGYVVEPRISMGKKLGPSP